MKISLPMVVELPDGSSKATTDCTLAELRQARKCEQDVDRRRDLARAIRLFDDLKLSEIVRPG